MKAGLAIAASFGLALLFAGAPAQPGLGASESARAGEVGEWSAAKKRRYVRYYRKPVYAYRAPHGRLGDPSLGPDGRPYPRPYDLGGCIFDEGYGRFSACPNR